MVKIRHRIYKWVTYSPKKLFIKQKQNKKKTFSECVPVITSVFQFRCVLVFLQTVIFFILQTENKMHSIALSSMYVWATCSWTLLFVLKFKANILPFFVMGTPPTNTRMLSATDLRKLLVKLLPSYKIILPDTGFSISNTKRKLLFLQIHKSY